MEESKETKNKRSAVYKKNIDQYQKEIEQLKNKSRQWVVVRLISFLAIPITIYFLFSLGWITTLIVLIELIAFLFFVRKSAENKEQLIFTEKLHWINEAELKAIDHDYSSFNDGKKYSDPKHAFSYDIDLFGKSGFFQYFNRTVSEEGEQLLVNKLLNGDDSYSSNPEAIEELTSHINWMQRYRANGHSKEQETSKKLSLLQWSKIPVHAPNWLKIARPIMVLLAIALSIAYYLDFINGVVFIIGAAITLFPISRFIKKTNKTHQEVISISSKLKSIAYQLKSIDEIEVQSEKLTYFKDQLFNKDLKGYEAVKELNSLIEKFEYRNNVLVALLLNFYLAWDFYLLLKLKQWKGKYGDHLPAWESIVYEIEVLISAATFRYNNTAHTSYAELNESNDTTIECIELGHPLIEADKRVNNNYVMNEKEQFSIITGPNMAGKSTFLRSIAVNLILAKAGFPVMAEKFIFPNLNLYSSMRTSDDLTDESSYFHAELIRLRFIVDAIEQGENVFIILDEILKGTNSKDKEEGSAKFLSKLIQLNARGIIATHDLKLTELAEKNEALKNIYFDTTISGDDISFDYTIRDGVAKNMNASFLLRKMGLSD